MSEKKITQLKTEEFELSLLEDIKNKYGATIRTDEHMFELINKLQEVTMFLTMRVARGVNYNEGEDKRVWRRFENINS